MSGSKQAWERVLAAVEADARRAEALLGAPAEDLPEPEPPGEGIGQPGVPAEWMLPGGATELPPLSQMPAVPEELRERIESLRDRIDALQAELAEAMRELRRPRPAVLTGASSATSTPHFVDRRI
jgi:hypothetical protein